MNMKGQQQALSAILITTVLIGVVGSVYFWGLPLIQKSKDVSVLENSEILMLNLNNKIKQVANSGGSDRVTVNVPGILSFDGENLTLVVDTSGSIYATGALIPLSKNSCTVTEGLWGVNSPEALCITSQCLGSSARCEKYRTEYKLSYIKLYTNELDSYKIVFVGDAFYGGENDYIQVENVGTSEKNDNGRNLISTEIKISIV